MKKIKVFIGTVSQIEKKMEDFFATDITFNILYYSEIQNEEQGDGTFVATFILFAQIF